MTLSPPPRGAPSTARRPGAAPTTPRERASATPLVLALAGAAVWAACTGGTINGGADDDGSGGAGSRPGVSGASGGPADGAGRGPGGGGPGGGASGGGTSGGASAGAGSGSADGLPCEVAAVLSRGCTSCHNDPLAGGAPMPLLNLAHLQAPSPGDASKTTGQRSVERMTSASSPMPPSGPLSDADIATIDAWVATGMPAGSCGGTGGGGASGGNGSGAGGSPPVGEGGLPCDVQNFLNAKCTSCHSNPPRNDAPMPLTSHGALVATNAGGVRFADRSLARLEAGTMPPGDALSAAEYKAFADWVNAGAPAGTCAPVDDPFDDPPTCSSGQSLPFCDDDVVSTSLLDDDDDDGGDCAGPTMNPGIACGSSNCHASGGEGPRIWFAGTVYRSGHEPDRCVGGPKAGTGQAQVVVTGANGAIVSRTVNAAGNFVLLRSQLASLSFPIRAEVRYDGRVRAMATPQQKGDCNGCHTQDGFDGAPGRIVLP